MSKWNDKSPGLWAWLRVITPVQWYITDSEFLKRMPSFVIYAVQIPGAGCAAALAIMAENLHQNTEISQDWVKTVSGKVKVIRYPQTKINKNIWII